MNRYSLCAISMIIIFIWIYSLPILFITSILWLPFGAFLLVSSATISFYIQWKHHDKVIVKSIWRDMMRCIPMRDWFKSFNMRYNNVIPENSLILAHPHGILCCGMTVYHFEQENTIMAVAPILFYIPIFGWFARMWGLIPATDLMIRKALTEGHTVILYIGGVQELIAHQDRKLYIDKRWGYLKIIKDLKCNVVSAWVKGEYDTFFLPPLPMLELRQKMVKWTQIGLMFPWIFGWNSIWMPKPVDIEVWFKQMAQPDCYELKVLKHQYHQNMRSLIQEVYSKEHGEVQYHLAQVPLVQLQVRTHQ